VLMCEAEAAIGARSDVLPEVKAAPGSAPCFGYCSYPVAPPVAEQALRPHVYAPVCRASTALHISHRTLVARLQEAGLVRLTTQETQERMLHARANVHAAPELVT
jgi:hypothetical protein